MSKNINVNTGHYKVAGREHQGHDILQAAEKGAFTQQRHEARMQAMEAQAGPPAWKTTPPNLEITDRSPKPKVTKRRSVKRKTQSKRKSASKQMKTRVKKTGIKTKARKAKR